MICPRCGTENVQIALYCEKCGTLLQKRKKKQERRAAIIRALVVLIAALSGVLSIVGIMIKNQEKTVNADLLWEAGNISENLMEFIEVHIESVDEKNKTAEIIVCVPEWKEMLKKVNSDTEFREDEIVKIVQDCKIVEKKMTVNVEQVNKKWKIESGPEIEQSILEDINNCFIEIVREQGIIELVGE